MLFGGENVGRVVMLIETKGFLYFLDFEKWVAMCEDF